MPSDLLVWLGAEKWRMRGRPCIRICREGCVSIMGLVTRGLNVPPQSFVGGTVNPKTTMGVLQEA